MKLSFTLFAGFLLFFFTACQNSENTEMADLIQKDFAFADAQYKFLMKDLPDDKIPHSYDAEKDEKINREISWWTSGFYPGSLWLIYEETKDPEIKKEAERTLKIIEPNRNYTGNHDVGFMIFCSFGNAYRITGDTAYYQPILDAAKALSTRYRPNMKAIQSWNKNQYWDQPVIIDNMMNLELLEWVSQETGDKKYDSIAVNHANTTLKNHYRDDYSSYHVVDYDPETGAVTKKKTWQGYSDSSAWSRGQAWGLYGYTMMYRFTKDEKYLDFAQKIAGFILNHPRLPEDKIPYWDYDDPDIPNVPRDVSAASITASALLELGQYVDGDKKQEYVDTAETILKNLSTPEYLAKEGENGGFLLKHSTGALSLNSEIDVPLNYADYYFLEALKRYKDWYL